MEKVSFQDACNTSRSTLPCCLSPDDLGTSSVHLWFLPTEKFHKRQHAAWMGEKSLARSTCCCTCGWDTGSLLFCLCSPMLLVYWLPMQYKASGGAAGKADKPAKAKSKPAKAKPEPEPEEEDEDEDEEVDEGGDDEEEEEEDE